MYCRFCGKEFNEADKFCVNCGEPVEPLKEQERGNDEDDAAKEQEVENTRHEEGRSGGLIRRIVIIILIIVSLWCVIGLCLKFFVDGPEETMDTFVASWNDMDIMKMIECMDTSYQETVDSSLGIGSSILSGITGYDMDIKGASALSSYYFKSQGISLPEFYIKSIEIEYRGKNVSEFWSNNPINFGKIEKVLATEATATVTYTLDGEERTEAFPFVKEGWGEWKMNLSPTVKKALSSMNKK